MADFVLFEDHKTTDFLPLVYWRSLVELRLGRKILLDRTAQRLGQAVTGVWTRDWIAPVAEARCGTPVNREIQAGAMLVNARWVPDGPHAFPPAPCVGMVGEQVAFIACDGRLASALSPAVLLEESQLRELIKGLPQQDCPGAMLDYPWDIIARLAAALKEDWVSGDQLIEAELDSRVVLEDTDHIHIGQGTRVHPTAVISAAQGPVYISESAQIGAQAVIEGPCYIASFSKINAHAWLHGANSIGPVCKVGGEVDGCVLQSYSNKQHDGFLGHAYVGSWVNLGAGTVNSDLKNTYGTVRVPLRGTSVDSGEVFFGAMIGDHAKTGINSTIPTGANLGFASVAACSAMLPKFLPSLGWLTDGGRQAGDPQRLLVTARKVMARRDVQMSDDESALFLKVAELAATLESDTD